MHAFMPNLIEDLILESRAVIIDIDETIMKDARNLCNYTTSL